MVSDESRHRSHVWEPGQIQAFIYERTDGLINRRVLGVPCQMLRTS